MFGFSVKGFKRLRDEGGKEGTMLGAVFLKILFGGAKVGDLLEDSWGLTTMYSEVGLCLTFALPKCL